MELFTFIVALLLLGSPFVDWTATYILYRAYKKGKTSGHNTIALSERATMAAVLSLASTANSILAVNRIFELHINNFLAVGVLAFSLLLVSVPNTYWLWLYLKNRF